MRSQADHPVRKHSPNSESLQLDSRSTSQQRRKKAWISLLVCWGRRRVCHVPKAGQAPFHSLIHSFIKYFIMRIIQCQAEVLVHQVIQNSCGYGAQGQEPQTLRPGLPTLCSSSAPRQRDALLQLPGLRVPPAAPRASARLLLHSPAQGGAVAPRAPLDPAPCFARLGAAGGTAVVRSLSPPSPSSSSALPAGGRCRKCRHFGVFCSGGSGSGGGTRRLPRDSASAARRRRRLRRRRQQLRQRRAQVQPLVSAVATG